MKFVVVEIDFTKYDLSKAKEIANTYGSAAVTEMMFQIQSLGLVERGELLKSLKYSVNTKHQEVERISFRYEWYGRFLEAGAENIFGKGQNLEPYHWRSNAIEKIMPELNAKFSEFYASLIADEIQIDSVKMKM